ncbi:hypothetical protein ACVIN2_000613 [Bradyrhizobium sp. USDA 3650]
MTVTRVARAETSGSSLIGIARPGRLGKGESPAWGKRGSLMGVKLGDFKELDASGRKWFKAETAQAAASLPGRPPLPPNPLLAFWASMGSKPRHFMKVGMNQKRVARLDRVLSKACSRAQKEIQTWRR